MEAAASVWDLEPCGAARSSRRALGSANSDSGWTQVGYCNISHTQTHTSKCTHTHTHKCTHISAWVIPKAFTATSLTGRKKKEWERLSKKKQTAEHTKGFGVHSSVLSFRRSLRRWIPDTHCTLWAPKHFQTPALIKDPFKTLRWGENPCHLWKCDLFDRLNEVHLGGFLARGT